VRSARKTGAGDRSIAAARDSRGYVARLRVWWCHSELQHGHGGHHRPGWSLDGLSRPAYSGACTYWELRGRGLGPRS